MEFSDGALDGLGVSDDVFRFKVHLFGDAVYNQDSWIPQVPSARSTRIMAASTMRRLSECPAW